MEAVCDGPGLSLRQSPPAEGNSQTSSLPPAVPTPRAWEVYQESCGHTAAGSGVAPGIPTLKCDPYVSLGLCILRKRPSSALPP